MISEHFYCEPHATSNPYAMFRRSVETSRRHVTFTIPKKQYLKKETYIFNYPGTPKEFVSIFKNFYGPTMNAFEAAAKNGKEEQLLKELEDLFTAQNKSGSEKKTSIPATFLRVTVKV